MLHKAPGRWAPVKQSPRHVVHAWGLSSTPAGAVLLTVFHSTGEILDASHRAVVLPLRFIKLHSSPEASGKLGAAAELQGSNLHRNIAGAGGENK